MGKGQNLLATALVVAFVAASAFYLGKDEALSGRQGAPVKESSLNRVLRTGTLRCAYIVYPPETIKDPNTGKLSGTIVETTEEIGHQLGLKVDWVAEVGFQDMFEGFKSGKYDALCSGLYETPSRSKAALFSDPFDYGATYALVRADDTRFDESINAIDDPNVRIAQIDGEMGQLIADESFSKAGRFSLPHLSDISQELESVATGKADVVFLQIAPARGFMEHNPGKLKVLVKAPARAFPAPLLAVAQGEYGLKYLIDATLRSVQENGFVERVLRKYDPALDSYLLVASPYQKR